MASTTPGSANRSCWPFTIQVGADQFKSSPPSLSRRGPGGPNRRRPSQRTSFQSIKQFLPCTAEGASQTKQNPERGTDSASFELLKVSCANIQLLRHELLREVGPLPETSDIATKGNELVFWEWLHARISRVSCPKDILRDTSSSDVFLE
jgi:hypothetical protein